MRPKSTILKGFFSTYEEALVYIFQNQDITSCIVTCETEFSVSVIKQDFYLFELHSRGAKGYIAHSAGRAMLMIFRIIHALAMHLSISLNSRTGNDTQFSLTSIKVTTVAPPKFGTDSYWRNYNNTDAQRVLCTRLTSNDKLSKHAK